MKSSPIDELVLNLDIAVYATFGTMTYMWEALAVVDEEGNPQEMLGASGSLVLLPLCSKRSRCRHAGMFFHRPFVSTLYLSKYFAHSLSYPHQAFTDTCILSV